MRPAGETVLIDETEVFVDLAFLSPRSVISLPLPSERFLLLVDVQQESSERDRVRQGSRDALSVDLDVARIREPFIADMLERVMLTAWSAFRGLTFAALEAVLRAVPSFLSERRTSKSVDTAPLELHPDEGRSATSG
jgi:hypothetical protein